MPPNYVIEIDNVSKQFGNVQALQGVSMGVRSGEVRALIGLNGSGKSTLVKLLSGFYRPDSGRLTSDGIAFVHQDLGLLSSMTVLENFGIGRSMATRRGIIDWRRVRARAVAALLDFGLSGLIERTISSLTQAQRTAVAIARALDRSSAGETSALVLDEPTSALPTQEAEQLQSAIEACAARGLGVLFITHRLQEVLDTSQTVTVLRNGSVSFDGDVAGLSSADLAAKMVGGSAQAAVPGGNAPAPVHRKTPTLTATSITAGALGGFSVEAFGGEILGIFGMLGSGVETVGGVLAGRTAAVGGSVRLNGRAVTLFGVESRKIGFVPSDRPHLGILPALSVRDNITLSSLRSMVRFGRVAARLEDELAAGSVRALAIQPRDTNLPISGLSGGNQQKAILARWFAVNPPALIADEPTQGVDVWAKIEILNQLRRAARAGAAVVLTALEPEEVFDFCDRVIVLKRGATVLDAPGTAITVTDVLSAMQ